MSACRKVNSTKIAQCLGEMICKSVKLPVLNYTYQMYPNVLGNPAAHLQPKQKFTMDSPNGGCPSGKTNVTSGVIKKGLLENWKVHKIYFDAQAHLNTYEQSP